MIKSIELTLLNGEPITVDIDDLVTFTNKMGQCVLTGKVSGVVSVKESYSQVRDKIEQARADDVELAYELVNGIYTHLVPLSTVAELIIKDDKPDNVILLFKDNTRVSTYMSLEALKAKTKRVAFPK